MAYRKFASVLASVATIAMVIAPALRAQPGREGSGIEISLQHVGERAAAAADPYAAAIAGNRNSPEYAAALRTSLNRAYRDVLSREARRAAVLFEQLDVSSFSAIFGRSAVTDRGDSLPPPDMFDFDVRYRENLMQLIRGGQDVDRIWNGRPTNGYQNTVAIVGGSGICTGTVIARNAVLTAQHCHCGGVNRQVYVGHEFDDTGPLFRIVRSEPMRRCNDPGSNPADAAVMFIDGAFPDSVVPARLAAPAQIDNARIVRAVGFGRTETGRVGRKMMVDIPVASAACNGAVTQPGAPAVNDSAYYGCGSGFELVAGRPMLDKDTCNGDSGGPIFVIDAEGGEWLAGATSRAVSREGLRPCGDGGIYVRVDGPVRSWLTSLGITI